MGARADADLFDSLTRIIDELDKTADQGISFTPEMTRVVTGTLRVVRDCHRSIAEYESRLLVIDSVIERKNVIPIRPGLGA